MEHDSSYASQIIQLKSQPMMTEVMDKLEEGLFSFSDYSEIALLR